MNAPAAPPSRAHDQVLFWGCFFALVTTAFGFTARMFLISTWELEFGLDPAQSGRLAGIGIWPFAVSIIGFSLIIDRIGYKVSMMLAFLGHITWAVMAVSAYFVSKGGDKVLAFQLLYWGSLILALGNGTVEAFINPVVATMFSKDKTKWLNILHAGWPGGLVIAGIILIYLNSLEWYLKVGLIAVPAVIYLLLLLPCRFPQQERVSSGVSYKDMLGEFGFLGACIAGFLVALQLMDFFAVDGKLSDTFRYTFIGIGALIAVGFGLYTQALGRFLMFFLVLIMIPLATTEIGTDGWITTIMEGVAEGKFHPGWVLVYTSVIMMILRFFAGPIIHALTPLGLLTISAALAIGGLYMLSSALGQMIFVAATLYGLGKTFFWPTMLGVVSEQMPKGGALTLNAISGIGMLAVGTLGFPYIGTLQSGKDIARIEAAESADVVKKIPGLIKDGKLTVVKDKSIYEIIKYQTVDEDKLTALVQQDVAEPRKALSAAIEALPEKGSKSLLKLVETPVAEQEKHLKELIAKLPEKNKEMLDGKIDKLAKDKKAVLIMNDLEQAAVKKKLAAKQVEEDLKDKKDEEKTPKIVKDAQEAAEKKIKLALLDKLDIPSTELVALSIQQDLKDETAIQPLAEKFLETALPHDVTLKELTTLRNKSKQGALLNMTLFPSIMLAGYLVLIAYFASRGGYKPVNLEAGGH